ncbi:MAG: sterol desaturase family protein [Myxococcales bacterium]|nr:sterol desaturase family protein [Myxococcales bacterium]
MIGIPLGLLYANGVEWLVHKHVLHGLGARKESMWSFHWYEHHKASRKNEHLDDAYERPLTSWNPQSKEALALIVGVAAHLPLLPVAPFFTATVAYAAVNYYRTHKRSHMEPGWAREHLPWHYDHHMGPNQHANWCVTKPWMDVLLGTREPYVGTEREARDLAKKAASAARAPKATEAVAVAAPELVAA